MRRTFYETTYLPSTTRIITSLRSQSEQNPSAVEALHNATITIYAALELCKFDETQQVDELARLLMKRSNN